MSSKEISPQEGMKALLESAETYGDLTLMGTDGVSVRCNRCILASRSPVFDKMLYGNFVEATNDSIELKYSGETIRIIVEYIYTNVIIALDWKEEGSTDSEREAFVAKAVEIADAAYFFEFPNLRENIFGKLQSAMKESHLSTVAFLEACQLHPSLQASSAEAFAKKRVVNHLNVFIEDQFLLRRFSFELIESILESKDDESITELEYFRLLHGWSMIKTETNTRNESRKRDAVTLMGYISLPNIEPTALSTIVSTSGLVSTEQLSEAFKAQALYAQEAGLAFQERKRRKKDARWKSSKSLRFDYASHSTHTEVLDCSPLRRGIHKWSVRVEEVTYGCLGVASSEHYIDEKKFLLFQMGWAYFSDGHAVGPNGIEGSPPDGFEEGDTISFVLDLTGNGSLSASRNGGASFVLFVNMKGQFASLQDVGFIPALSFNSGSVTFLGFED